mmetsp:Transcript_8245/g.24771  ORF Transcript_8245/g.24771 Transcript_8245/m.24771 type:complete len:235 (+) Transcript_8245:1214-1918(+)
MLRNGGRKPWFDHPSRNGSTCLRAATHPACWAKSWGSLGLTGFPTLAAALVGHGKESQRAQRRDATDTESFGTRLPHHEALLGRAAALELARAFVHPRVAAVFIAHHSTRMNPGILRSICALDRDDLKSSPTAPSPLPPPNSRASSASASSVPDNRRNLSTFLSPTSMSSSQHENRSYGGTIDPSSIRSFTTSRCLMARAVPNGLPVALFHGVASSHTESPTEAVTPSWRAASI